jgi:TolA-binding protein
VLELYPNSRRAPTALYKSGLLELRRGNADDARTFFNRVVQGYPDSDEFELAQRELDRLSS